MSKSPIKLGRVVFLRDLPYENDRKWEVDMVKNKLDDANVTYKKFKVTEDPRVMEEEYDLLCFDYGGISIGNDLLGSLSRHMVKHAQDNPNKYFLVVSTFTQWAIEDAIERFGIDKPFNICFTPEELEKQLRLGE